MDDPHRLLAELAGQFANVLHEVAADWPHVARGQAGNTDIARPEHGCDHMRKQQVAEVVAVEGAEKNGGSGHGAASG